MNYTKHLSLDKMCCYWCCFYKCYCPIVVHAISYYLSGFGMTSEGRFAIKKGEVVWFGVDNFLINVLDVPIMLHFSFSLCLPFYIVQCHELNNLTSILRFKKFEYMDFEVAVRSVDGERSLQTFDENTGHIYAKAFHNLYKPENEDCTDPSIKWQLYVSFGGWEDKSGSCRWSC